MGLISDVLNRTHGHRLIELIILIDSPRRIDLIGNDFSGDENNDNELDKDVNGRSKLYQLWSRKSVPKIHRKVI